MPQFIDDDVGREEGLDLQLVFFIFVLRPLSLFDSQRWPCSDNTYSEVVGGSLSSNQNGTLTGARRRLVTRSDSGQVRLGGFPPRMEIGGKLGHWAPKFHLAPPAGYGPNT